MAERSPERLVNLFKATGVVLHRRRASALRAAMHEGYPLHIVATSEHGKGGLFLCLDAQRGWVLHALKIASENAEALRPGIAETIRHFGDPIAVVRDLSTAEADAVEGLRKKGIPDLLCHYHFLGAIGLTGNHAGRTLTTVQLHFLG